MLNDLTVIERRILELICRSVAELGRPPSVLELTEATELRSVASLHWYLDRLQEKRLIRPHPTRARAIEVDCQDIELAGAGPATETAMPAPASPPGPATSPPEEPMPPGPGKGPTDAAGSEVAPESAVVEVPLLGDIAAGDPSLADAEVLANYRLPRDLVGSGASLFMLRIRGSSMTGAGILDGDLVVVRRQSDVDDGEVVAVRVGDEEATVKRLSRAEGRVRLLADNEEFEPIEPEQAAILGKVVTVIRRIR
jgi:repressor LexA